MYPAVCNTESCADVGDFNSLSPESFDEYGTNKDESYELICFVRFFLKITSHTSIQMSKPSFDRQNKFDRNPF